jgi:hypothetical protein
MQLPANLDERVVLARFGSKYFAPAFDGLAKPFWPVRRVKRWGENLQYFVQFLRSLRYWQKPKTSGKANSVVRSMKASSSSLNCDLSNFFGLSFFTKYTPPLSAESGALFFLLLFSVLLFKRAVIKRADIYVGNDVGSHVVTMSGLSGHRNCGEAVHGRVGAVDRAGEGGAH